MSWSYILSDVERLCQLHACLELLNSTVHASFIRNLFPGFINLFRIFHTCIGAMTLNTIQHENWPSIGSRDHCGQRCLVGTQAWKLSIVETDPAPPFPGHWSWQLKGKSVNIEMGPDSLCIFRYQLYITRSGSARVESIASFSSL